LECFLDLPLEDSLNISKDFDMSNLFHPNFQPVRQVTPQQAFQMMQGEINRLTGLIDKLADGFAELYGRFSAMEQHLGITVVEQPVPTTATGGEPCPNCGSHVCAEAAVESVGG
jgi:hypothetical protein